MLFALSGGTLIGYVDVGAPGCVDGSTGQVPTVELNQPTGPCGFHAARQTRPATWPRPREGLENMIGINLSNRVLVLDTGDPGDIGPIANFSINVKYGVPLAEPNTRTVPIGTLQTAECATHRRYLRQHGG